jgi:hypothetical protein
LSSGFDRLLLAGFFLAERAAADLAPAAFLPAVFLALARDAEDFRDGVFGLGSHVSQDVGLEHLQLAAQVGARPGHLLANGCGGWLSVCPAVACSLSHAMFSFVTIPCLLGTVDPSAVCSASSVPPARVSAAAAAENGGVAGSLCEQQILAG